MTPRTGLGLWLYKMPCFHLHLQQSAPRSTSGQTPRWHRWRFLWSGAASCGVWCEACSLWFCRSGPENARFWLEVHLVTRRWKNYWSDAPSFYAHHHLHWLKNILILKWAFSFCSFDFIILLWFLKKNHLLANYESFVNYFSKCRSQSYLQYKTENKSN